MSTASTSGWTDERGNWHSFLTRRTDTRVAEVYLMYRLNYGIRDAVAHTAAATSLTRDEVCTKLGLDLEFSFPKGA
jgi:hypothetical protein